MKHIEWKYAITTMAVVSPVFLFSNQTSAQSGTCPFLGFGSGMMGGAWGLAGGASMIFFWILVVVGIVLLIRWLSRSGDLSSRAQPPAPRESPLEILKRRYASGEINKEQYESMKQDLQ
jgi:putative membrane protein